MKRKFIKHSSEQRQKQKKDEQDSQAIIAAGAAATIAATTTVETEHASEAMDTDGITVQSTEMGQHMSFVDIIGVIPDASGEPVQIAEASADQSIVTRL